jgi:hypothetical protein
MAPRRLVGRRIPVPASGDINEVLGDLEPGDYVGPYTGYSGEKPAVTFLKPNARDPNAPAAARSIQFVVSPPHVFTEEDDGTLTITPSIGDRKRHQAADTEGDGWHGYLTKGVWQQV